MTSFGPLLLSPQSHVKGTQNIALWAPWQLPPSLCAVVLWANVSDLGGHQRSDSISKTPPHPPKLGSPAAASGYGCSPIPPSSRSPEERWEWPVGGWGWSLSADLTAEMGRSTLTGVKAVGITETEQTSLLSPVRHLQHWCSLRSQGQEGHASHSRSCSFFISLRLT